MQFGADINAYTSHLETVYSLSVPKGDDGLLTQALKINNEWLFNLEFAADEVNAEKGVILEERRQFLEFEKSAFDQRFEQLYSGHLLADRSPIVTEESVSAATPESLAEFYERWYHPDNATIVVAGVIDPEQKEQQLNAKFTQDLADQSFEFTLE